MIPIRIIYASYVHPMNDKLPACPVGIFAVALYVDLVLITVRFVEPTLKDTFEFIPDQNEAYDFHAQSFTAIF